MSDDGYMANSLDFDDPDIELALFKHGLIAHLIHHPPASGRLEGELRALAGQTYQIPHSRRTRVSISSLRRSWLSTSSRSVTRRSPRSVESD